MENKLVQEFLAEIDRQIANVQEDIANDKKGLYIDMAGIPARASMFGDTVGRGGAKIDRAVVRLQTLQSVKNHLLYYMGDKA